MEDNIGVLCTVPFSNDFNIGLIVRQMGAIYRASCRKSIASLRGKGDTTDEHYSLPELQ